MRPDPEQSVQKGGAADPPSRSWLINGLVSGYRCRTAVTMAMAAQLKQTASWPAGVGHFRKPDLKSSRCSRTGIAQLLYIRESKVSHPGIMHHKSHSGCIFGEAIPPLVTLHDLRATLPCRFETMLMKSVDQTSLGRQQDHPKCMPAIPPKPKSTSVPFSIPGGRWQLWVLRISDCMTQSHEVHVLASAANDWALMTKCFGVDAVLLLVMRATFGGLPKFKGSRVSHFPWEDSWSHASVEAVVWQSEGASSDVQQRRTVH